MTHSTTKATFNYTLESVCGTWATGGHDISPSQYRRICAILSETDIQSEPSDTRSTFSGAADYDQTVPFNGVVGEAA